MLKQMDPASGEFESLGGRLRSRLLDAAGLSISDCEVQFSGFGAASALQSALRLLLPPGARLLVPSNGPLARRAARLASHLGFDVTEMCCRDDVSIEAAEVAAAGEAEPFHALLAVHVEPSTGVINPLAPLGRLAMTRGWRFIADATLTFGGSPIDLAAFGIDALATSSGFCLESAPGLGILLAPSRSCPAQPFPSGFSGDWDPFATPLLLALDRALVELEQEGGVEGRAARYRDNYIALVRGMAEAGFHPVVRSDSRSCLITRFEAAPHARIPNGLCESLAERGFLISDGPVVANIGRIYPSTIQAFLSGLRGILAETAAA